MLGLTCLKKYNEWKAKNTSRNTKQNPKLLIVGLSATATEFEQAEAFLNGAHFYCPKPTSTDVLLTILSCCRENSTLPEVIHAIRTHTASQKCGIKYPK
jgi:DNA-binding NarL/FixJ family response regulator